MNVEQKEILKVVIEIGKKFNWKAEHFEIKNNELIVGKNTKKEKSIQIYINSKIEVFEKFTDWLLNDE